MATIEERLDEIAQRLDLVATGAPHAEGHILIALSNLLEVVRAQQIELAGLRAWLAAHDRNITTLFSDRI